MDATSLMLAIVFGSIGMGLFIYGKRQQRPVHLFAGLLLMVCPYVLPSPLAMTGAAVVLIATPFLLPV